MILFKLFLPILLDLTEKYILVNFLVYLFIVVLFFIYNIKLIELLNIIESIT